MRRLLMILERMPDFSRIDKENVRFSCRKSDKESTPFHCLKRGKIRPDFRFSLSIRIRGPPAVVAAPGYRRALRSVSGPDPGVPGLFSWIVPEAKPPDRFPGNEK